MLNLIDRLPRGLLEADAMYLYRILPGPTLINLPGRRKPSLFVSLLLHGNEDTGWNAVRQLLRHYSGHELPRALSIFIGNVEAAGQRLRRLENQPDYNRIWPGGMADDSPERNMMQQVYDEMQKHGIFASVDIHNNSGLNPHYACVNRLDASFLQLATLFNRIVVYATQPAGVQSMAFAQICPAVTLECGHVDQHHGVEHALDFLEACLHLSELPSHPVPEHDIELFHIIATVKVAEDVTFGFPDDPVQPVQKDNEPGVDICFADDLDHLNFRELPEGTVLGTLRAGTDFPLSVRDQHGRQVGDHYFRISDNVLQTARPIMPSMLTVDAQAIRQDCLCYLMERIRPDYQL